MEALSQKRDRYRYLEEYNSSCMVRNTCCSFEGPVLFSETQKKEDAKCQAFQFVQQSRQENQEQGDAIN